MTVILGIICMIIVYMLVHLGIMYLHSRYQLFLDEELAGFLHVMFGILGFFLIGFFIMFIATL